MKKRHFFIFLSREDTISFKNDISKGHFFQKKTWSDFINITIYPLTKLFRQAQVQHSKHDKYKKFSYFTRQTEDCGFMPLEL